MDSVQKLDRAIPECLILALIALLWGTICFYVPLQMEDWNFNVTYLRFNGGQDDFSLQAFVDLWMNNRGVDNSRLANVLSPLATTIPPFTAIYPWLSGAVLAGLIFMVGKLGLGRKLNWQSLALVWLSVVLFLPWRSSMFIKTHQLGYAYTAFFNLVFIYLMLRQEKQGWKWPATICTGLVAAVAANMHEGFSVPILCGLGAWAISRKLKMSWQFYAVGAVYLIFTVWILTSEGVWSRFFRESQTHSLQQPLPIIIFDSSMMIALVFGLSCGILFRKTREIIFSTVKKPAFILLTVAAVAAWAIGIIVSFTSRTAFLPQCFCLCAIWMLLRDLMPGHWNKRASVCAILALTLCSAHACTAIIWQKKIWDESEDIFARIFEDHATNIYYDIVMPETVPAYTLQFPTKLLWHTGFSLAAIRNKSKNYELAIVPTALRDANPENSSAIEGNARAFIKDGAMFRRLKSEEIEGGVNGDCSYSATLSDGSVLNSFPAFQVEYANEAGEKFVYIRLNKIDSRRIIRLDY